jgi:hypothetical protein
VIEPRDNGVNLVVTGPWSTRAAKALQRGDADGLTLNYARGFCEPTLEFLENWPIRRLDILDRSITNLSPIECVALTLTELSIEVEQRTRLDAIRMPRLCSLDGEWALIRPILGDLALLISISTGHFDEADFLALCDQSSLTR